MKKTAIFLKGIIKENPVLVLLLGTCPTLATTSSVVSALAMGVAAMLVLFCSNIVISALRKVIPDKVRIPCYIVVIAGFVSIVQMLMQAYLFARKNSVFDSALDGLGMGIGFTLALVLMATIREVLGAGTFAGIAIPVLKDYHFSLMTAAPGGFLAFGLLIALVNKLTKGKAPAKKSFACEGCPNASACGKLSCENEVKEEETNA